ncbi:MAG TPA: hypothetical protein VLM79_18145 [Kofleriaceae bacterium]|nr:hypothetical protein [Kofleriaceae bacterium]
MFTSDSRYRRSAIVATVNLDGQPIHAAELRTPPPTPGTFLHRVEEGERIDNLANRYYRDPLRWWRIADANPAFATPDDLLGNSVWITERIALLPPTDAAWAPSLAAATQLAGVVRLVRDPRYRLTVELHTVGGEPVEVVSEQVDEAVIATYHAEVADPAALRAVFTDAGFAVTGVEVLARTGQSIVIPPERG